MCAMLTIQIDPTPGTSGAGPGVYAVAELLPVASGGSTGRIRPITGVVVAVGTGDAAARVEVPAGEWLVRATMPSGEVLSRAVTVGANEPASVALQGQLAPSDELSGDFASGAVPSARRYAEALSKSMKLQGSLRDVVQHFDAEELLRPGWKSTLPDARADPRTLPADSDAVALPDLDRLQALLRSTMAVGGLPSLHSSSRASVRLPGSVASVPDAGGTLSKTSSDAAFIKAAPRVAIAILENEIERDPRKQLVETQFSTVLARIDVRGTEQALASDMGVEQLASRLFGVELERRPSELSGPALLKTATIEPPADVFQAGPQAPEPGSALRAFGWLRAAGDKTFIAAIPHHWQVSNGGRPARLRAIVSGEAKDPSRVGLRITVDDPSVASILGFLQSGDLDSAERIIRQSIEYLHDKHINPYAAAAAAYALVHAQGAVDLSEPWPRWIRNLCDAYPDIPDGPILLATLLLQRNGERSLGHGGKTSEQIQTGLHECRELLVRAVCCGPPVFRLGLKLLAQNIDIVRGLERERALDDPSPTLGRAAALARWMSLRVDTTQPFTVLRI